MREVNMMKLPFTRSGWWEHGGREISVTTSAKVEQHSVSQQHPGPEQRNKASDGESPGIFETAAPPCHFLASESAVWHPGRCFKCDCIENILVST